MEEVKPLTEAEFQKQVLEELKKLNDKFEYLLNVQRQLMINSENIEHSISLLDMPNSLRYQDGISLLTKR